MNSFNVLSTAMILLKQYSECHQNSEIVPLCELKNGQMTDKVIGNMVVVKDFNSQKNFMFTVIDIEAAGKPDPVQVMQKVKPPRRFDPGFLNFN